MPGESAHYDWIIVGSGFGGSVSALRLAEKGYRVLVVEKGRRLGPAQFPTTNWDLPRWLWMPLLNWRGLFKMTFFRHVTIFSGVGVGGGSLVYANTLPVPKDAFFASSSWSGLADWKAELGPHYQTALRMLGAAPVPFQTPPDRVLGEIAADLGRPGSFEPATVSVWFGEAGKTVSDPYFGGEGPERTGCNHCGGCMTGCRFGAKNTLDRNYLYLAERRGVEVLPDTEVLAVRPRADGGYAVEATTSTGWFGRQARRWTADRVVFAGGVLGTLDLLARMKADPAGLPRLSDRLGELVRTNSEALIAVMGTRRDQDMSRGVAIGSIFHTSDRSHIEPVRYAAGSNFFRLLVGPHVTAPSLLGRLAEVTRFVLTHPLTWLRAALTPDMNRFGQILLYMRTDEGTLRLRRGRGVTTGFLQGLLSAVSGGEAPQASLPEATDLARRFSEKTGGVPASLLTETLLGIPSTAHILGGACMGADATQGVIDVDHQVFGYPGLYVIDGSAISANPGVNPSLTITALAERAMSRVSPPTTPRHSSPPPRTPPSPRTA